MILYGRSYVEVVVAVEGDNVVRPLDGGLIRCPLFRHGSVMDDERNIYRFLARVQGDILFEKCTAENKSRY